MRDRVTNHVTVEVRHRHVEEDEVAECYSWAQSGARHFCELKVLEFDDTETHVSTLDVKKLRMFITDLEETGVKKFLLRLNASGKDNRRYGLNAIARKMQKIMRHVSLPG